MRFNLGLAVAVVAVLCLLSALCPLGVRAGDYQIDWKFGSFDVTPKAVVEPGDSVIFRWAEGSIHAVKEVAKEQFENCQIPDGVSVSGNEFAFTATTVGTHYFVCPVNKPSHCNAGMKLEVEVTDSLPSGCAGTQFGCCPDGTTAATGVDAGGCDDEEGTDEKNSEPEVVLFEDANCAGGDSVTVKKPTDLCGLKFPSGNDVQGNVASVLLPIGGVRAKFWSECFMDDPSQPTAGTAKIYEGSATQSGKPVAKCHDFEAADGSRIKSVEIALDDDSFPSDQRPKATPASSGGTGGSDGGRAEPVIVLSLVLALLTVTV